MGADAGQQQGGGTRHHFQQLARQISGYSIGLILNRFAGIILFPIYTRVLTLSEYGVWGLIQTISTLCSVIFFLGLDGALPRFYSETEDPARRRQVAGTIYAVVGLWSTALILPALALAPLLAREVLGGQEYAPYLRIAFLTLPWIMFQGINLHLLRVRFALASYNALALGNLVLGAGLAIFLAGVLDYGIMGLLLGLLIGYIFSSAIGIWMNRSLLGSWDRGLLRPMLAMGLPLLPANLSFWILNYIDRWFLTGAVGFEELGRYEAANRLTIMVGLVTMIFQAAWGPFSYWIETKEGALRTYAKSATYYTLGMLFGVLGLGLFARELLMLFTPAAYHQAAPIVALLAYGPAAYGAYTLLSTGVNLKKQTSSLVKTMLAAMLTNIMLNALLISYLGWGIMGAAIATAASFGLATALIYRTAQRVYPIPYEGGKIARGLAIQVALMALLPFSLELEYWPGLALRVAALVAYPVLLWIGGCIDDWELRLIGRALRHPERVMRWIGGRS